MRRNLAEIESAIRDTLEESAMLPGAGKVVVGCSGGADSMALLHALFTMGFPVLAAHINHQLRGEEALRDEAVVREFCRAHAIPFHLHREDVAARAAREGQSIEQCGRTVRYAFFESLCSAPEDRIATAHTRSDSVETVLFHLAKGTGIRGLQGIPPVRGRVVRPLIALTRAEIEAYCHANSIPYVQDSSNNSRDYTRNRIRLDVVPVLRSINPALEQAVGRMSLYMRELEAYLNGQAREVLQRAAVPGGYDARQLCGLPKPLQAQVVLHMVQEKTTRCGLPPIALNQLQMEQACRALSRRGGQVSLGAGLSLRVERTLASVCCGMECGGANPWEIPLQAPQTFTINRRSIAVHLENCANFKKSDNFHKLLFNNSVDYGTIRSNAIWRSRRAGDSFTLPGRNVTKTLKKLFNEAGIPPSRRDTLLLLAQGSTVLWIEGFGAAQGHGVTAQTKRALQITIKEDA